MGRSATDVWNECLELIRARVSAEQFSIVFAKIQPLSFEEQVADGVRRKVLMLQIPSQWYYEQLEDDLTLNAILNSVVTAVIGRDRELLYSIGGGSTGAAGPQMTIPSVPTSASRDQTVDLQPKELGDARMTPYAIPAVRQVIINPNLNPEKNIENFVKGGCNELGYEVARQIGVVGLGKANSKFNPLYIFGASGLGKTHLAQSIGIAIRERHPDRYVLYVAAMNFLNEYTEAVSKDKMSGNSGAVKDFINRYESLHVLILDDVHELAHKSGTQDVLFSIFNYLLNRGCHIIFTSLYKLVDMQGFREELLSRFKSGIQVELLPPDFDTRLRILKRSCYADGIDTVSEEVLKLIAERVKTNVRELKGVFFSVFVRSLTGEEVTVEFAESVISDMVRDEKKLITMRMIIAQVCEFYHLTPEAILSKQRKREVSVARQIIMYLSRELLQASYKVIGEQLGNRSHATCVHGCAQVEKFMETERRLREEVETIRKLLLES
ncbi:MAG: chromosomal replication initiator protein DnaA [Bacteroidia bacterium]|nr:MAG: chromosomal replication initiator protein DnaA [Bacteroidia bacterium]